MPTKWEYHRLALRFAQYHNLVGLSNFSCFTNFSLLTTVRLKATDRLFCTVLYWSRESGEFVCVCFSQIFEYTGKCVAISEPDSPNVVATKYRNQGDTPEVRKLARDIIRLECRPYPSLEPIAYYAIKLTAPSAVALQMFQ